MQRKGNRSGNTEKPTQVQLKTSKRLFKTTNVQQMRAGGGLRRRMQRWQKGPPQMRTSQGGYDGRRSQEVTPNNASRRKANSGANGGRSHNGALVEMPGGTRGATDRGRDGERWRPRGSWRAKETERPSGLEADKETW